MNIKIFSISPYQADPDSIDRFNKILNGATHVHTCNYENEHAPQRVIVYAFYPDAAIMAEPEEGV